MADGYMPFLQGEAAITSLLLDRDTVDQDDCRPECQPDADFRLYAGHSIFIIQYKGTFGFV